MVGDTKIMSSRNGAGTDGGVPAAAAADRGGARELLRRVTGQVVRCQLSTPLLSTESKRIYRPSTLADGALLVKRAQVYQGGERGLAVSATLRVDGK